MPGRNWIRQLPSYKLYQARAFDSRQGVPYLIALMISSAGFALRWGLDSILPAGIPFLTFFPAVMIAAFTLGLWPSILASLAGLLWSWYFFLPPFHSFELNGGGFLALVFYVIVVAVNIMLTHLAIGAIHDADRAKREKENLTEYQEILIRELDHRIKNLFTVVASLVKLSARYASSPVELADDVSARILALGRSHSALWRIGRDADATVQSIARQVLEPFLAAHAGKIMITGQSPVLDVRQVQILSLIFHELATNAVKYGALAQSGGQVLISSQEDEAQAIKVVWKERGIAAEASHGVSGRKGYGTELIERLISGAGGQLTRMFEGSEMTMSLRFSDA